MIGMRKKHKAFGITGTDKPDNVPEYVHLDQDDSPNFHPLYGDLTGPVRPTLLVNHRYYNNSIAKAYALNGGWNKNVSPQSTLYGERYSNDGNSGRYLRYGKSSYTPPGKLQGTHLPDDD